MRRAKPDCNYNQPGDELLWQTKNQFKQPLRPLPAQGPAAQSPRALRLAMVAPAAPVTAAEANAANVARVALAAADVDAVRVVPAQTRTAKARKMS
jgi:hypothetical protein